MASITKRNGKWCAEVRKKGFYRSKRFLTKLEAQAWAVEQEQRLASNSAVKKGMLFSDALRRYAEEVSVNRKGQRWELIRIKKFSKTFLADVQLLDLTHDDIQRWMDDALKKISPASVRRELDLLSAILETATKQWKWLDANPCKEIKRPKSPPPRDRRISEEEIQRILDSLCLQQDTEEITSRDEVALAFLIAIETAMRQGEIWGLDWRDVFLEENYVKLHDTKNGTPRDVPLSSRAVELFKQLKPKKFGKVLKSSQSHAGQVFRRAVKIAGIENLTFHDTRHEALTRLARKLDVLDLARMVGHRDPRSLMIYYNATATEIAQRLG